MSAEYKIKEIKTCNIQDALSLAWRVFLEFEAPDYSREGIREFEDYIKHDSILERIAKKELVLLGCYDEDKILGILAMRQFCHISLLFVDKQFHRKGIARALLNFALENLLDTCTEITVNSSPYAVEIYRKLGFCDTDKEQTVNGIRFVPMKKEIKK